VLLAAGALGVSLALPRHAAARASSSSRIAGPLPDTAGKGILVWDVEPAGYVAEEYFLSGLAPVYRPVSMADAPDVASRDNTKDLGARDFSRQVLQADQPFTTRLIVYRPRSPRRFSGKTIIETLHPSGGGTGVAWNALRSFFIANGDAYIGVQHPLTIAGIKGADAERYHALAMIDPTQLWGMLIEAGRLIKEGGAGSPLHGYKVAHLIMTGYSYTGVATATFANYHHAAAKLANGRSIFDAYVPMANAQYVRPLDVPVIRLNTQCDFSDFGGLNNRRADDLRYRQYEVAGASHVAVPPPAGAALPPKLTKTQAAPGQPHFSAADCQALFPAGSHPDDYPLYLVQEAVFANLYRWLDTGNAPPASLHIDTNADGSALLDQFGNAQGGLRLPQVSQPIATYGVGSTTGCTLFGYTLPFDTERCRMLYGDRANYLAKVEADVNRLVTQRLLLPDGAKRLLEIARASANF
jgi:hypothetical protein